jgi:hypothetical protein
MGLATFETLILDTSFAMGDIANETIVHFIQTTQSLRAVITTDQAANLMARSEPAPHIEHLVVPGKVVVVFDGGGLPKLRRVDAERVPERWLQAKWFARLAEFGCADPTTWQELREGRHAPAIVLAEHAYLHAQAPTQDTPWELVAQNASITARPLPGSTGDSLKETIGKVASWKGVEVLRIPQNFLELVTVKQVRIEGIAPVEPVSLGLAIATL